jgi:large subunit ribosomal protein L25
MGNKIELKLDKRDVHGKKVAKLRKEGVIPGIIYGASTDPISVQVAANIFEKVYRQAGTYTPVYLTIDGQKKIAMIKDVDIEPVKGLARHISFHAVKASDPVMAEVPIRLIDEGESEAEKAGLVVLQVLEKIEVKALPMDLPDAIEVSVLGLKEAGDKVTLEQATLPEGVEYVERDDGKPEEDDEEKPRFTDQMVASVWEPAALQAANEATAGDATDESEVATEGEEESGEAEKSEAEAPAESTK